MEEERGKYYSSGPRVRKKGGERVRSGTRYARHVSSSPWRRGGGRRKRKLEEAREGVVGEGDIARGVGTVAGSRRVEMTLTGVCHCPRQIISNIARCIPILFTSTEAFSRYARAPASSRERGKENRVRARLPRISVCARLRHNCRAFVSYTRIIGLPRHVGPLLFRPSRLFLYFRARKGRRES